MSAASSPGVVLRFMSVAFLECKTFHDLQLEESRLRHIEERKRDPLIGAIYGIGLGDCCPKCHEKNHKNLIYVRPFQDGVYGQVGNTDWDMCIEAIVCCKIYDFVRALPREWWIKKATELNVYREDSRGYIYPNSPHRNTTRLHAQKKALAVKISRCRVCSCKVSGVVCDNCGAAQ